MISRLVRFLIAVGFSVIAASSCAAPLYDCNTALGYTTRIEDYRLHPDYLDQNRRHNDAAYGASPASDAEPAAVAAALPYQIPALLAVLPGPTVTVCKPGALCEVPGTITEPANEVRCIFNMPIAGGRYPIFGGLLSAEAKSLIKERASFADAIYLNHFANDEAVRQFLMRRHVFTPRDIGAPDTPAIREALEQFNRYYLTVTSATVRYNVAHSGVSGALAKWLNPKQYNNSAQIQRIERDIGQAAVIITFLFVAGGLVRWVNKSNRVDSHGPPQPVGRAHPKTEHDTI